MIIIKRIDMRSLTCENRFVRMELSSTDSERYVAKFLVLK